jgi:hypothetical protein
MNSELEQDEYLTRCVVNTSARTFNLYSNLGEQRVVKCANVKEFMNVLSVVRKVLDEGTLAYADPLVMG